MFLCPLKPRKHKSEKRGEPNDKALEQDSASPDGTNTSPLSTQSQQPEKGWFNNEDDEESPKAQETGGSNKIPHATAFESEDSDQGSEDFSETMQRPDLTGKASAHATTFESKDFDQGYEDFSDRETMQRPDSIGKASKASARRNNIDIGAHSPIRPAPLQKSLGRKPTPATQVRHFPASQVGDMCTSPAGVSHSL
ncbi:hypothetical protein R1sor_005842 [Riccia sorocarpa]|uniref:Uncharacterized protein n=1 Tax=Riccia sorocarpa TaxID=122646 RepID=A0ABD3HMS3_9MARC